MSSNTEFGGALVGPNHCPAVPRYVQSQKSRRRRQTDPNLSLHRKTDRQSRRRADLSAAISSLSGSSAKEPKRPFRQNKNCARNSSRNSSHPARRSLPLSRVSKRSAVTTMRRWRQRSFNSPSLSPQKSCIARRRSIPCSWLRWCDSPSRKCAKVPASPCAWPRTRRQLEIATFAANPRHVARRSGRRLAAQ